MKKKIWHIRIPTFSAFAILFFSIFVTSFLLQKGVGFIGQASPDRTPQNVIISNITDSSFTVSFVTHSQTVAAVSLNDGQNSQTFFDARSNNNPNSSFYSHYVVVSGLAPERRYEFSILSGGETYTNAGLKYNITTAPKISTNLIKTSPISGRVLLPDGSAGADVVVIVEIPGGQTISQITNADGTYKIVLDSLRTSDLDGYFNVNPNSVINLRFMRQNLESTIKSVFSASQNLPATTLSYAYDFSNIEDVTTQTVSSELKTPASSTGQVAILNPVAGQSFIDERPLFQGSSGPRQRVNITIDTTRANTTADATGLWSYRPPSPLSPGAHRITVQSIDSLGLSRTATSTFTVYAQGSQIANAFPSVSPIQATPTNTPTPTSTPRPTATPIPTNVPISLTPTRTPTVTSTPIPTIIPTGTPTPTILAKPTVTPTNTPTPAPKPGKATPVPPGSPATIAITVLSTVLIVSGGIVLILL